MSFLSDSKILLQKWFKLSGRRGLGLVIFSGMMGLGAGLLDILFSKSLAELLRDSHGQSVVSSWQLGSTFFIGLGRFGFLFLTAALSSLSHEAFLVTLRRKVIERELTQQSDSMGLHMLTDLLSIHLGKLAQLQASMVGLLSSGIIIIMACMKMMTTSFISFVVAIFLSLVCLLPFFLTRHRIRLYSSEIYENQRSINKKLLSVAQFKFFLRLSDALEVIKNQLEGLLEKYFKVAKNYSFLISLNNSLSFLSGLFVILPVIYLNSRYWHISEVALAGFLYLLYRVANSMGIVVSSLGNIEHSLPSLHVVSDFFYGSSLSHQSENHGVFHKVFSVMNPSLDVEGLSAKIPRGKVKQISFKAKAGDRVFLVGASGVGKSITLQSLLGLTSVGEGSVCWGIRSTENKDDSFRSKVGFAMADPFLFEGTIRENLLLGLAPEKRKLIDDEKCFKALDLCKSLNFVRDLPDQLDFWLKDGGLGLSTGQKQRIALARAFLRDPDVYILDEATSNLDEETELAIFQSLIQACPDRIFLVVSHRNILVEKIATQVVKIEHL